MGRRKDSYSYLPRINYLYKRYMLGLQPLKTHLLDEVEEILGDYNLRMIGAPKSLQKGGRSHTFVVSTSEGKVVFKKYKPTVALPSVIHEHSVLRYLAKTDLHVPRLLTTHTGETYVHKETGFYALSVFMEGYNHYTDYILLPQQMRSFIALSGETLAILHESLRDFVPDGCNPNGFKSKTGARWRDIDWYTDKLAHCVRRDSNGNTINEEPSTLTTILLKRANWINDRLQKLDHTLKVAAPTRHIIHGDYNPRNVLFKPNAPVIVLDFEIARLDWGITDLTRAIFKFTYKNKDFDLTKLESFLNAYISRYAVSIDELRLIPTVWQFLLLRRIIVCWDRGWATPSNRWEVEKNLRLIDWIVNNQNKIVADLENIYVSS